MTEQNITRPIDTLNQLKGRRVLIRIRNGEEYNGILEAIDLHINTTLKDATEIKEKRFGRKFSPNISNLFIRGEAIVTIKPI